MDYKPCAYRFGLTCRSTFYVLPLGDVAPFGLRQPHVAKVSVVEKGYGRWWIAGEVYMEI